MASLLKLYSKLKPCSPNLIAIREGHHLRGKPPGVARSLKQRLEELNYKDPELTYKVNIGFPLERKASERLERLEVLKRNRNDSELEKKARSKTLDVSMEKVHKEWLKHDGKLHIKKIAEHYGVFEHLFGDAYFIPKLPMEIYYNNEDISTPVYYGNIVKPSEATQAPEVKYESEKDELWTLILTNPDGHLSQTDSEYVHWFIANIPGNEVEKGETLVNYLQPFPPKGTGFHRHVFILYKQEKALDLKEYKKIGKCLNLEDRTFSTLDFYRKYQEDLTPASLCFFQSDWDPTLTDFFHHKLDMKEPIYEYDFPETYVKPQEWFPLREAFNLYMDRYRDPKQINKEFLQRKLKHVHPFKPPKAPLAFPNAQPWGKYVPSWLKLEKTKSRLGWGRINDIK